MLRRFIVVSIEIELPTALENAQLPAFSSLLQLISKRNDYIAYMKGDRNDGRGKIKAIPRMRRFYNAGANWDRDFVAGGVDFPR